MLTLGIRYLQGVVVGSHGTRERVEWPPHPARVFMAMVAAHYHGGAEPAEREALVWLEKQPPPDIHAPDALPCGLVQQYVPVNDKAGPATALMHSLLLTRNRQSRTFARASLASDSVMLRWPTAEPEPHILNALNSLCAKVTRIGHSSSLVQMWVADAIPDGLDHWRVDENASQRFRVPREGTLSLLDEMFNGKAVAAYSALKVQEAEAEARLAAAKSAHTAAKTREKELKDADVGKDALSSAKKAKEAAKMSEDEAKREKDAVSAQLVNAFPYGQPRQDRPRISSYEGYALVGKEEIGPKAKTGVFSPHLAVFILERIEGPYRTLDLACTLAITDGWRKALASHANDLSAEAQSLLTGHAADKSPLRSPHVALLPLGFVGHRHATGHLPGIAMALPDGLSSEIRDEIHRAAARVCKQGLKLGRLGVWKVDPSTSARPLETLRPTTWTANPEGATHWSTVTPIAFDQHPKAKGKVEYLAEVVTIILDGCERIRLPRPREVIPTPVSAHLGAPPMLAFPRLRRKDGSERRHTHAILIFKEAVVGPVLLGAGRYRGYGLCRPMPPLPT